MTEEQVKALNLGLDPITPETVLMVEAALQYVLENTRLKFDLNSDGELAELPARVRLFAVKFVEIMGATAGVTSESISGHLSQSFSDRDRTALLWELLKSLLGGDTVSDVKFRTARSGWRKVVSG